MEEILTRSNLNEKERHAIVALCERIHSAESLAEYMGLSHFIVANNYVGSAGKKIYHTSPDDRHLKAWYDEGEGWYHIIAPGFRSKQDKKFYWEIRPRVKQAVIKLGWHCGLNEVTNTINAEERTRFEGNEVLRLVSSYERDPSLRAACLELKGFDCSVCGLNMGDVYGELGEGFIHVHHITPLHQSKVTATDPNTNLAPVCPNCHSIIHRGGRNLTIEALRDAIEANKSRHATTTRRCV